MATIPGRKGGSSVKKFSCLKCGTAFDAYPADDLHNVASRDEETYPDHVKIDYKCRRCGAVNTIYWGHPKADILSITEFGE